MKFRPCIDIHNGKVKQIVGGSLRDTQDQAVENFVSKQDAAFFAEFYRSRGIDGGHVILLNAKKSVFYNQTKTQALEALAAFPGGLQAGGGITSENAAEFLDAGASHVIVTSYVFNGGQISYENLEKIEREVGKERLTLDLSCRKRLGEYYIVTNRWQTYTDVPLTLPLLQELSSHCDEFLIHAVDVEGKARGIEVPLVRLLAELEDVPVTYAGGVGSFQDLEQLKTEGKGKIDVTIGSALDLFGGNMALDQVLERLRGNKS